MPKAVSLIEPSEEGKEQAAEAVDQITYDVKVVPVFSDEARVCNAYQVRDLVARIYTAWTHDVDRLRKQSDSFEERWRYCGGAYALERDARQKMGALAKRALDEEFRDKDQCNCDQSVFYHDMLQAIDGWNKAPSNEDDLNRRLSRVLVQHGDRLNAMMEFWSEGADKCREAIDKIHNGSDDNGLSDDEMDQIDTLEGQYQSLTGHAMAAAVFGMELKGDLERISLTVDALDKIADHVTGDRVTTHPPPQNVSVSGTSYRRLKAKAAELGISIREALERVIEGALDAADSGPGNVIEPKWMPPRPPPERDWDK